MDGQIDSLYPQNNYGVDTSAKVVVNGAAGRESLARVLFERLDSVRGSADGLLKSVSVGEAPGCVAVYSRD